MRITVEDVIKEFDGSVADYKFDPVQHAKHFFKALYGDWQKNYPKQYFEIRIIYHGSNGIEQMFYADYKDFLAYDFPKLIELQKEKKFSIFYGVCPRKRKSGKNEDIKVVPCLWCDIDSENKSIFSFKPQADIIVFSGRGHHGYWKFQTPLPSDTNTSKLLKRIQKAIGSDTVHDFARVMRVPGTINPKNNKTCKIAWIAEELCHDI